MSDESRPPGADSSTLDGPRRKAPVKRKHTIGRVIIASLLVLGLVTGLGVTYLYRHLNGNLNVQDFTAALGDDRPEKVYKGNGQPLNVLVMGDDSRDCEGCKLDAEGGGGSDTTILVHLSADRSRAYAVSIPRDSIVDRPSCGEDDEIPAEDDVMWNAAYNVGGPACTIRQVEATTGVFIDHFVVVNFNGFKDMVDAVGGVPVCIPRDINDQAHGIVLKAGERELAGDEALSYVRVRHVEGTDGSDIGRIKRQQAFIAALVNKVKSKGTLARLDRVVRFLDAATSSLMLDEGIGSVTRLGKFAMQMQDVGLDKVQFLTVPNDYFSSDSEFRGRVYWTDEAQPLWDALAEDRSLSRKMTSDSINAERLPGSSETPSPTAEPTETESATETASPSQTPSETTSPSQETSQEAAEEAAKVGLCA